jgi:D-3-phosphoglycerate dehydrogenase
MTMINIAITIRSFDVAGSAMAMLKKNYHISYINKTGRHLSDDELIDAIKDAHGVIAGTERFSEKIFHSSPKLQVVSRVGTGLDSIDLNAAKKRNIQIFSTPESPVQAVAEHSLGLMLSILKNIPGYNDAMRHGIQLRSPGFLLSGKKVGIVGLGRIGTRVGTILDMLGCRIAYYDPFLKRNVNENWEKRETLVDLVKDSDILTLHAASGTNQKPLIDAKTISACKKGIIIINCARGSLIDELALISGLKGSTIGAAGLDVFNEEPYTGHLLAFPQVITTPHVASNTVESRSDMEMESVENINRYFKERSQ